jgi:4-hydroxy-tetrahydrodipicolinate reductase
MAALGLAIAGAAGRMGRELTRAIAASADLRVAGATERAGAPSLGRDIGVVAGLEPLGVAISADPAAAAANADGWIDFTAPEATLSALRALASGPARFAIVGTTGFDEAGEAALAAASKKLAIVRSANFSLGVTLLTALVRQAAQALGPDWDIEIVEAHHRRKVDAPSGTALRLGEAAAAGRNSTLAASRLAPRDGLPGARPEGGIGFAVVRGGGIFGDHDVMFASEQEILTLSHRALDRGIFVRGALAAARWAAGKPPGLYSVQDVLGLPA